MACNCITEVDEKLKDYNTKISPTIIFKSPSYVTVTLVTEQIEKGRGKKKAVTMLPSHCPFCGVKYEEEPVGP